MKSALYSVLLRCCNVPIFRTGRLIRITANIINITARAYIIMRIYATRAISLALAQDRTFDATTVFQLHNNILFVL